MLTAKAIVDARIRLLKQWGESGRKIIKACATTDSLDMKANQFLDHCLTCGGNWGAMLLSGIRELRPEIWRLIPDDMGVNGFEAYHNICCVLMLCGVDISED